ncbi:MAG: VCBS repeat-containing protein [bacterium]|nr:VCBS repeat-containing protein [bacterium]
MSAFASLKEIRCPRQMNWFTKRVELLSLFVFLLALAALLPVASAEAAATFGSATNITPGTNPRDTVIADFNGDAINDLAIVNAGSSNISVFLGVGDGTFGARTNFTVGSTPVAIAAADLNGDNKQDLVVANGGVITVSVLIGDGAGLFADAVNYGAVLADFPSGLALGDINGANGKDILVTNANNAVTVLLNNGSGVFGVVSLAATVGAAPTFIVALDLDGDTDIDFANVNGDGDSISIGLNNGSGSFTVSSKAVGDDPVSITSGDFDGDGDQDLAAANYFDNNVSVLLGVGDGSFGSATNYTVGTNPWSITSADLDGDGNADLATANNTSNNVSVLIGAGNGTFGAATSIAAGTTATFVRAADFSGDNKLDLAVANYSDNTVSIFLNTTVAAASTNSGGAGLSGFVRRLQGGFAARYASRAYIPRDLALRAEHCTSTSCDAILQFKSPEDAELERFTLHQSENHRHIPFAVERNKELTTFRFPWPSNAELPVQLCYTHQNNAEFCVESRIWTPAAFAASEVNIEQLGRIKDQFVVTLRIPSFNNFSYITSGKSLVLVKVYDADGNLMFKQSVNRSQTIKLLLDPRRYTIRMTPVNAAGEEGATVTIPLDVYLLTTKNPSIHAGQINVAQQRIFDALNALFNRLIQRIKDMGGEAM